MKILEYGDNKKKKIILIHGFQMHLDSIKEYIEKFKNDYCVIVPILPGHDPKNKEEFESFNKCLSEFEEYYIKKYGNEAYAVIAFSMGGVFASYIWQSKKIKIKKIIMESSPLLKWNNIMIKMMTSQYIKLTNKTRQRDDKTIKQAVQTIVRKENLESFLDMMDNMSDETITRYLKEVGAYNLPKNIDTKETEVYYLYGGKISEIIFKKVGKYIGRNYKNSHIKCIPGKGHCEDAILNPKEKAQELMELLNN